MSHNSVLLNGRYSIVKFQILYTGDFSRQEDRHLMAAEIPTVKPDVLIMVSYKQMLKLVVEN